MNIKDYVNESLSFFADDAKIIDEVLFIGAWARYFYKDLLAKKVEYQPRLAAKDLDVLLQRSKKANVRRVDVHQALVSAVPGINSWAGESRRRNKKLERLIRQAFLESGERKDFLGHEVEDKFPTGACE